MDSNQFHRRVLAMVGLLAVVLVIMGSTLYRLQITQGAEYRRQSQYKIAEKETVEASRGWVTDRNGRVLVSNETVYQVRLDTSLMEDEVNHVLLSLLQAARETGAAWNDSLPITAEPPFAYTTDEPFYVVSQQEDGSTTLTLTRFGRLCVKMKWIEDPTKQPAPAPEPAQPAAPAQPEGLLARIKQLFSGKPSSSAPTEPAEQEQAPYSLPTAQELLETMCAYFELSPELEPVRAREAAGVRYELLLRSKLVYQVAYLFAEEVDIDFISRVKEQSLPGVIIEPTTLRRYHTQYAAHLLGRVGLMNETEWAYYQTLDTDEDGEADYEMNDSVGKEGVEKAFESVLRGVPGVRVLERSTNGKVISETWLEEPQPGDNVVLTLDIDLQGAVENILAASIPNLISQETEGAACVVLGVDNAEVLACASYPTFDLANYSRDYRENAANPLKPLFNRAIQGTYAPGSTFKMVTGIAALEEDIVQPNTVIRDTGRYLYYAPSYTPACWIFNQQGGTHGNQTVADAIKNSCNYYFYEVGRLLGIDRITDYASRFGLGQKTGLELTTEAAGVMAGPEYTQSMGGTWYDGNTLSVAIGQESSQFTPLQLANYIATLVNGGTRNATHLLREIKSSDFSQTLSTYEAEPLSIIEIEDDNLNAVKAGMLALTTSGSVARYFQDLGVQVGAKTGSAQVSAQTESNAVFVCFAPYEDPEIAVAMVVEHGGSGSELGAMAADILSYYFSVEETRETTLPENTLIP